MPLFQEVDASGFCRLGGHALRPVRQRLQLHAVLQLLDPRADQAELGTGPLGATTISHPRLFDFVCLRLSPAISLVPRFAFFLLDRSDRTGTFNDFASSMYSSRALYE